MKLEAKKAKNKRSCLILEQKKVLTVHVHVPTAGKSLFTDFTLIWFFACVSIGVFLESQLGSETFTTYLALERLGVILCMKDSHMSLHSSLKCVKRLQLCMACYYKYGPTLGTSLPQKEQGDFS